jgi:hypothetical protein
MAPDRSVQSRRSLSLLAVGSDHLSSRRGNALLSSHIFNVADIHDEGRQPTEVDQALVPAAVNIAGRVFAAAVCDDLADQFQIIVG